MLYERQSSCFLFRTPADKQTAESALLFKSLQFQCHSLVLLRISAVHTARLGPGQDRLRICQETERYLIRF